MQFPAAHTTEGTEGVQLTLSFVLQLCFHLRFSMPLQPITQNQLFKLEQWICEQNVETKDCIAYYNVHFINNLKKHTFFQYPQLWTPRKQITTMTTSLSRVSCLNFHNMLQENNDSLSKGPLEIIYLSSLGPS